MKKILFFLLIIPLCLNVYPRPRIGSSSAPGKGYLDTQYWRQDSADTTLTGDKTGTFDLTTTGTYTSTSSGRSSFSSGIIVNEASSDSDTRVEGNTDENLLFIDAGNDRVGVGTATPAVKLDVVGGSIQENTDSTW